MNSITQKTCIFPMFTRFYPTILPYSHLASFQPNPLPSLEALEQISQAVPRQPLLDQVLNGELHRSAVKVSYPSTNRYGRPYISGRPLLTCDRKKIVDLFESGMKKIRIAKQLGITHSCVSKVLRRYQETGSIEARVCRTASCSCPGSAANHDKRYCKHLLDKTTKLQFTIENLLAEETGAVIYSSREMAAGGE